MKLMMMAILVALGCASGNYEGPKPPTLFVVNGDASPIGVYIGNRKIGTAWAGDTCIRLSAIGSTPEPLIFRVIGGAMIAAPLENLKSHEGWVILIGPDAKAMDMLSLQPAASCLGD